MVIGPNEMLDCQDVENAQVDELLRPYRKRIVELEELHLADEQSIINMQRRIAELEAEVTRLKKPNGRDYTGG